MFSRNIFTTLCLKSETSTQTQFVITLLYILSANILRWYQFETYIGNTPRKMGSQDDIMNLFT